MTQPSAQSRHQIEEQLAQLNIDEPAWTAQSSAGDTTYVEATTGIKTDDADIVAATTGGGC